MSAKMKKELINDVLTGLALAATYAAVLPADAMAQLSQSVGTLQQNVGVPFTDIVSLLSYGIGVVLTVAGIAGAKKHADAPSTTPLGPALGKLGAGAAFLAAPAFVKMIASTGVSSISQGNATFGTIAW